MEYFCSKVIIMAINLSIPIPVTVTVFIIPFIDTQVAQVFQIVQTIQ